MAETEKNRDAASPTDAEVAGHAEGSVCLRGIIGPAAIGGEVASLAQGQNVGYSTRIERLSAALGFTPASGVPGELVKIFEQWQLASLAALPEQEKIFALGKVLMSRAAQVRDYDNYIIPGDIGATGLARTQLAYVLGGALGMTLELGDLPASIATQGDLFLMVHSSDNQLRFWDFGVRPTTTDSYQNKGFVVSAPFHFAELYSGNGKYFSMAPISAVDTQRALKLLEAEIRKPSQERRYRGADGTEELRKTLGVETSQSVFIQMYDVMLSNGIVASRFFEWGRPLLSARYRYLMKIEPVQMRHYRLLNQALYQKASKEKNYKLAYDILQKMVEENKELSRAYYLMTIVLTAMEYDHLDEFVHLLDLAIQHNPYFGRAHHVMGLVLALQKRPADAQKAFTKAVAFTPAADSYLALADFSLQMSKVEDARKYLEEATRKIPESKEIYDKLREVDQILKKQRDRALARPERQPASAVELATVASHDAPVV